MDELWIGHGFSDIIYKIKYYLLHIKGYYKGTENTTYRIVEILKNLKGVEHPENMKPSYKSSDY